MKDVFRKHYMVWDSWAIKCKVGMGGRSWDRQVEVQSQEDFALFIWEV